MRRWTTSCDNLSRTMVPAIAVLLVVFTLRGVAQHLETSKFNSGPPRPIEDSAVVAHGHEIYEARCQSCHAADLRGATGPSVLRSQAALTDQKGDNLIPIMQGQDKSFPLHKIDINLDDSAAVAAYVRSIVSEIGSQGRAPGDGQHPQDIVIGDAAHGKQYFALKCATCHSAEGDLKGFATRVPAPRNLQVAWLRGNHFGVPAPAVKATVTAAGVKPIEGTLVHLDDFLITLQLPDGTMRTVRRIGAVPKVVLNDPLEAHRNLLRTYTDSDIHNVTAYLVTLK